MKKILIIACLFLLFILGASVKAGESFIVGKAHNIQYEDISMGGDTQQIRQIIDVEILNGQDKGKVYKMENIIGTNPYYDIHIHSKDKLLLHTEQGEADLEYFIADLYRMNVLYFLAGLFCLLVIVIGRLKGLFSLVSIAATVLLIFSVLCPMILAGVPPLAGAILVCLLSTVVTMYLVGGINSKSTSATAGTVLSLIVAGAASLLTIKFAKLTGFSDETILYLYSSHPELDYTSITAAVIIIAALGAVMDIAMSIASTVNEIYQTNKSLTVKELFDAGMNVGRDIIGTMANTLILVYMGGALPLLLLAGGIDAYKFFNLNAVVTEISSAIIGSIALLLCVPITAIISANLIKFTDEKLKKRDIMEIEDMIKGKVND